MGRGEADGHFQNYAEYARILRTWLVAYGIGGPVLLVTNLAFADRLAKSGHVDAIGYLFLLGVALQVLLALVNKWCAYATYAATRDPKLEVRPVYRLMGWVNDQIWIDVVLDLLSVTAFAWGTLLIVGSFIH